MTTSRTDRVRLTTGVELHYREEGDPGAAEVLLFLHGWPDSAFSFSRVWPLLPAYRCLAVDQRGFGDSERPDAGYTVDDLAADADAFLEALDVRRATLVGHSMGSFVARRVAERFPDRVEGLVLIGTAPRADNDVVAAVAEQVGGLSDPIPEEFVREFQAGTTVDPLPAEFFDGVVAESLKAPARMWQAVLDGLVAFDDTAELGAIAAPTLVLGGEQDPLFSADEPQALADAVPGARLVLHPGTGHCLNWEHPVTCAEEIAGFVTRTATSTPGR